MLDASQDYRIELLDQGDALAVLQKDWDRLLLSSDRPHIHHSYEWLSHWWRHFGGDCKLCVLRALDSCGEVLALAPFITEPLPGRIPRLLGLRRLSFLGRHLIDSADILAAPAASADWAGRFARELLRIPGWHSASLRHLMSDSPTAAAMKAALAEAGLKAEISSISRSPRLLVTGSFADYYAGISSGWRYDIERNLRRLAKAGTPAELRLIRSLEPAHLEALCELNTRRADSGDSRRSPLLDPARFNFLKDLIAPLNARGWWRLAELRVGDRLAAYQLGFVLGGTHYFWNIAQEPDFAPWSVGKILLKMNLEACWAEGLHTFDFMAGDEPYKSAWTKEGRDNLELSVTRPSWRTQLAARLQR